MLEDRHPTATSKEQNALEKKILPFYQELDGVDPEDFPEYLELNRDLHIAFLHNGLGQLSSGFAVLDASRTWIVYWIVHALALLGAPLPKDISVDDIASFLNQCQHPEGGFGGGPMQLAHLAPTYAAVAAAVTLGGKALDLIDRPKLRDFLIRMCIPPEQGGGFTVHEGGEGDLRACYCAMAVASLAGLDVAGLAARAGLAGYVRSCQTYEGGLGGEPGNEAHGGYTYCGVAALLLAGGPEGLAAALDVPRLLHWLAHRQGSMEGGFNGRTNKLVDGCYSFWQGAVFPLLAALQQEALHPPQVPPAAAPAADVAVPPGPMLGAMPPFEVAEEEAQAAMERYRSLKEAALAASDAADVALVGQAARHSAGVAAQARALLDSAAQAHELAEQATTTFTCIGLSAYALVAGPPPPLAAEGAPPPPPLFNNDALQLWILKCCQASKGGLRDKPGKPVDHYHTAYCLSGLAAAQQAPGGRVLGPASNALARTDPRVNVVADKLAAARERFARAPLPPIGPIQ